ncbi:Hint domain-containing protein [Primorskyibacter sp. 2E107]|uniref:Hint domain-containing protein n=1 Tax=Primorskyibacter sp. 2E107 TaxID=3403458 RepID=UPI003AF9D912
MPTYEISGYADYQVDTTNNASLFQGTQVQNFTFDDGEGDTTFENGDVLGSVAGNDLNYLGNMQVDLVGGGSMELLMVQGAARYTPPEVIQVLVVVPAGMSVSDFSFPNPIDYASRQTDPFPTCFATGTEIATQCGSKTVETLEIGDMVATHGGSFVPVKWVGRQKLVSVFARHKAQPVRFRAGSLGDGLPHTDLMVTGDHGMLLDGLVINASALVNGTTVDWVPLSELANEVTYFHIETADHNVILANGAEAETFVDPVGRRQFDNYQEYLDLYGVERIVPEMNHPRITSARLLPDKLKTRLGIDDGAMGFVSNPGLSA